MQQKKRLCLRLALLMGTALGCTGQALALDASWSGAVDGNFGTPGNWVGGAVPDGTASFGASPVTSLGNVALGSSFGGFSFGGTTGPYSFSGVSGNFTGGGIVNADPFVPSLDIASGGTLGFLNSASAGNAALNATAAGSSLVFGGTSSGGAAAVTLGASSTLDISSRAGGISLGALNGAAGSQVLLGENTLTLGGGTFGGAASGSGGLTVASGTVTLTGPNTYQGPTTIASGATLRIGNGGTSGTLPGGTYSFPPYISYRGSAINDGTLVFNRSDSYTGPGLSTSWNGESIPATYDGFMGVITGTGALRVERGDLTTDVFSQGSVYVAPAASLRLYLASANVPSVVNDGTLTFSPQTGRYRYAVFTGAITGSGSLAVAPGFDSLTLRGSADLAGSLTVNGPVQLIGTYRFGGGAFVAGNLAIGSYTEAATLDSDVTLVGATPTRIGGTLSFGYAGTVRFDHNVGGNGDMAVGILPMNVSWAPTNFILTGDVVLANGRVRVGQPAGYATPAVLQIGDGGTSGSVAADIVNYGAVAFNRSDAVIYDHVISGPGQVRQIGPGTLTLSGANTYTGATTVEAGTLSVTGSIASSSGVTVMSGATLSGTGVLPSVTVQSGGTFAPGNSVGTATVSGNLSLASGSTTAIEVQGATADRINVTGAASLAGTLKLIPLGGSYAFNTPYTLIAAQGGRSGTFSTVSTQGSFGAGVTSEVSYTPGAVNLTLTPASLTTVLGQGANGGSSASPAVPGNLAGLIAALDAARLAGRDLSAFFGAYNAPAALLGTALNQLTGEVTTASNGMGLLAGQEFMTTMLNPFREGRETVLGHRIRPDESADGDDWFGGPPQRYAMWGQATGAYSRLSGDGAAGSATRSARGAGFAMGFDMAVGTQSMVGVALAAGETSASLSGGLGRANAWTGQLGVFGRTRLDTRVGGLTLEGAASVSFLQTDTKRTQYFLNGAEQRASTDARVYSFRLEGRHDGIRRGGISLRPLLALQAQVVDSDGYSERSSAPGTPTGVAVAGSTNSTVRTELGVQAEGTVPVGTRAVRGFGRVAWGHYLMREQSSVAALQAFPGQGFVVQGARPDADSAILAAGLETEIAPRWTLGARIDSELSGRVREVAGTVRVRYAF